MYGTVLCMYSTYLMYVMYGMYVLYSMYGMYVMYSTYGVYLRIYVMHSIQYAQYIQYVQKMHPHCTRCYVYRYIHTVGTVKDPPSPAPRVVGAVKHPISFRFVSLSRDTWDPADGRTEGIHSLTRRHRAP